MCAHTVVFWWRWVGISFEGWESGEGVLLLVYWLLLVGVTNNVDKEKMQGFGLLPVSYLIFANLQPATSKPAISESLLNG